MTRVSLFYQTLTQEIIPGHCDPVNGDMTFFIAGGCRTAPDSSVGKGFKYLSKIDGVKKVTKNQKDENPFKGLDIGR